MKTSNKTIKRAKEKSTEGCGRIFADGDYWAKCGSNLSLHGFIDLCGLCREAKRKK